jgi:hypothetical protein
MREVALTDRELDIVAVALALHADRVREEDREEVEALHERLNLIVMEEECE